MQHEERYKLLFGPYRAPQVQPGDKIVDAMRGPVVTGAWSQGRIPWPTIHAKGRSALVFSGDLVAAVQQESSLAIQYWWGVSASTVHRWRQHLGVEQYTAGTRRLHRQWLPEKMARRQCQDTNP